MTSVNDSLMYQGSCNVPTWGRDTSGNVTGLVGPDGNIPLLTASQVAGARTDAALSGAGPLFVNRAPHVFIDYRNIAELSLAAWTGGTGTLEVTREVEYNGQPTLKVTMPSACTRVELGVTSGLTVPSDWADTIGAAIYLPSLTGFGVTQIYLGDASYTNYQLQTHDLAATGVVGWNYRRWDNRAAAINEGASTNPGTITSANVAQAKIRINKSAGAAGVVYLSLLTDLPRHKAKILFTADDGYDEWYSWLYPQAVLYGVPWALGIDYGYIGTNGFLTGAQIREMAADVSGLLSFYSHGKSNQGYSDVGTSAYVANLIECGDYLKSLGVSDPYAYHPYVKGQRGDDLDALLIAAGVKVARLAVGVTGETYKPAIMKYHYGSNPEIKMRIGLSLESTVSLDTAKTAMLNAATVGGVFNIMAHEFVISGASGLQWTRADTIALMAYALDLQSKGLVDIISASELVTSLA